MFCSVAECTLGKRKGGTICAAVDRVCSAGVIQKPAEEKDGVRSSAGVTPALFFQMLGLHQDKLPFFTENFW